MIEELDPAGTAAVVAVQRLQAAYGDAVTRRDWAAIRALFEPDAQVHIDTRAREPFTLDGPDELAAFIESALEDFTFFEFAILNAVVAVDGDTATGRMYIAELRIDRTDEWTQAFGLYQDRYARRDGRWRIAAREYTSLARTGPQAIRAFPLPPFTN